MAVGIGSNILSLTAQRHLGYAQHLHAQAAQRLASGFRINSSRDDAAGIAVAGRLGIHASGLHIGLRNANEAVSVLQITESALDDAKRGLIRLRELALLSANANNAPGDRHALQQEASQILAEFERLTSQTHYNGQRLLDGSAGTLEFQLGASSGDQFRLEGMPDLRALQLGSDTLELDGTVMGHAIAPSSFASDDGLASESDLRLETARGGSTGAIDLDAGLPLYSARQISNSINAAAGAAGIAATAYSQATLSHLSAAGTVTFDLGLIAGTVSISVSIADQRDLTPLLDAINANTATTGYTASFTNIGDRSALRIETADGRGIRLNNFASSATGNQTVRLAGVRGDAVTLGEGGKDSSFVHGTVTLTSSMGPISARNSNPDIFGGTTSTLAGVSIASAVEAGRAIDVIDGALSQISGYRSKVGAWLNRLGSVTSNLTTGADNLGAARGRIMDADYAIETASLLRNELLQQAGMAMVAQANLQPRVALRLLRA